MTRKTICTGVDCGNNSIKIVPEQMTKNNFQNVYMKVRESNKDVIEREYKLSYGNAPKLYGKSLRNLLHVKITKNGKGYTEEYLFGQACMKFKNEDTMSIAERGKDFKHNDIDLINNSIIVAVNSQLELLTKEQISEDMKLDLSIGVGLPISEYNAGNSEVDPRKIFENNFLGEYTLEFLHPQYPIKKVNLKISNVKVSREGLSPLNDSASSKLYDEDGNSLMSKYKNKYFLVMDGGCYTYDIAALKVIYNMNDMDYTVEVVSSFTDSAKTGIGTALDSVLSYVNNHKAIEVGNNRTFDRQEISIAIMQDGVLEGEIDISDNYINSVTDVARANAEFFYNKMERSKIPFASVEEILICGGSAKIPEYVKTVKEVLLSKYPKMDNEVFKIAEEPVMQNAISYLADISDVVEEE